MSHPSQDTNTSRSTHTPVIAGKIVSPTAVGTNNALEVRGDFAVWDTVASKFVLVDQTTFGTINTPKNQ